MDLNNFEDNVSMSDCPVCGSKNTLRVTSKTDNIPYFGDIFETSVLCEQCGYQSSDSISLEQNDPVKYILKIDETKMNTRVAKSQTATITIPELGLKVEPGAKSQGYVSNVEGILNRFEDAVLRAIKLESDNSEVQDNALNLIELITQLKMGELSANLILEDPWGNSLIDDDDAKKVMLTQEEVDKLETGFTTIDQ